jgi:hypothetical protein
VRKCHTFSRAQHEHDDTFQSSKKLTFTEGAALIILIAPKRANAAGAALVLLKTLLAAKEATVEGKRIMLIQLYG